MPLYESVFIARQDASGQQVEDLSDDFKKIIKDNGGDVPKSEYWGLRSLAYRIKKNRKGHYVLFNINAPHEAVAEMERNMRLNEDILRYMTLKIDKLEEGPSIVMRAKAGRDDGSRRDDRDTRNHRHNQGEPQKERSESSDKKIESPTKELDKGKQLETDVSVTASKEEEA